MYMYWELVMRRVVRLLNAAGGRSNFYGGIMGGEVGVVRHREVLNVYVWLYACKIIFALVNSSLV